MNYVQIELEIRTMVVFDDSTNTECRFLFFSFFFFPFNNLNNTFFFFRFKNINRIQYTILIMESSVHYSRAIVNQ